MYFSSFGACLILYPEDDSMTMAMKVDSQSEKMKDCLYVTGALLF